MPRLLHLIRTTALGLLLLAPLSAPAQTAPAPVTAVDRKLLPSDPQAIALLTRVIRTYQGLKSYAVTETATSPENTWNTYQLALTYAQPDRVRIEVTRGEGEDKSNLHIASDDTNYFAFNSKSPKRYLKTTPPTGKGKSALSKALGDVNIQSNLLMVFLEHGDLMLQEFTGPKSSESMKLSLGKPDTLDGVAVDTILTQSGNSEYHYTVSIQVGRDDHLIRRIQTTEGKAGQLQMTIQTFTDIRVNFTPDVSVFSFKPPMGAVAMTPPGTTKSDAKAVALMSRMYAAYNTLNSFSCTVKAEAIKPTRDRQGNVTMQRFPGEASYQFQQPNKIAFSRTNRQGTARAICDGQTLYAMTDEDKEGTEEWQAQPRYLKRAAPASDIPWNDKIMLARFGGMRQYGFTGHLGVMPEVVLGVNNMPAEDYGFQVGTSTVLGSEPVDVVTVVQQSNTLGGIPSDDKMILTLWISQRDHLLRQVKREWMLPDGSDVEVETYTDVIANPELPASTFKFTPPANAIAVEDVEALYPPRPVVGPKLNVGDAVPAAVFGATDINGKSVKADNYTGKVTLLDFWGTWCGPCIRQIPSLVAAYRQYHDQGLEIIGYALESSKTKDKLPAFALKHNMTWPQVWDKDAVIANACGPTNGVPFVILVGRDGRVAAVGNPGDPKEGGVDVEAEIKAALAKPMLANHDR